MFASHPSAELFLLITSSCRSLSKLNRYFVANFSTSKTTCIFNPLFIHPYLDVIQSPILLSHKYITFPNRAFTLSQLLTHRTIISIYIWWNQFQNTRLTIQSLTIDNFDQDYYPTMSLADLKKKNLWKRKRDENRSDRKEFRFTN